jgi:inhibitor of KinA sporulation pathway (predicted exonuclease)
MNHKYYLIIDLEATCCDRETIQREEMETIEIGAVLIDADGLKIIDEYSIFIRPKLNPILTEFCKTLTTITQDDVDKAVGYIEAMERFKSWFRQYDDFLFCSWGDYDKYQFKRDCELHKIEYPFGSEHLNIKKEFAKKQGVKPCGLDRALDMVGLKLLGTHHLGIDDARNMGHLMPYIVGDR